MSHPNSPEYWTITNIDPHDGNHYLIGIFKDIDAVYYRMKQMYLQDGSELRIECHRLIDAEEEATDYNKLVVTRAKYKREEEEKEAKLKELEEIKAVEDWKYGRKELEDKEFEKMMNYDPDKELAEELAEELASHDVG